MAKAIGSIKERAVGCSVGRSCAERSGCSGTHCSEFEVEIGALSGKEQERILREIRQTLSGERGGGYPGVTFAVNTFLTERIEETIAGFAAPMVDESVRQFARSTRRGCAASCRLESGVRCP